MSDFSNLLQLIKKLNLDLYNYIFKIFTSGTNKFEHINNNYYIQLSDDFFYEDEIKYNTKQIISVYKTNNTFFIDIKQAVTTDVTYIKKINNYIRISVESINTKNIITTEIFNNKTILPFINAKPLYLLHSIRNRYIYNNGVLISKQTYDSNSEYDNNHIKDNYFLNKIQNIFKVSSIFFKNNKEYLEESTLKTNYNGEKERILKKIKIPTMSKTK